MNNTFFIINFNLIDKPVCSFTKHKFVRAFNIVLISGMVPLSIYRLEALNCIPKRVIDIINDPKLIRNLEPLKLRKGIVRPRLSVPFSHPHGSQGIRLNLYTVVTFCIRTKKIMDLFQFRTIKTWNELPASFLFPTIWGLSSVGKKTNSILLYQSRVFMDQLS